MNAITCRFCNILRGNYLYIGADEPIAENEDFVAIASIGALIEGWTLIFPRYHQCSMKSFYKNQLFKNLADLVIPKLYDAYGPIVAFEHGANKNGSSTGCGVDHAHLHLVPLRNSLLPDMKASGHNWIERSPSTISSIVGENEYLFYIEFHNKKMWDDPVGYLNILEKPESKFFRRLIARNLLNEEMVDYIAFPFLSVAEKTRTTLLSHTP